MNITIREEQMSEIFTKFHLEGLPVDAVIHRFKKPDTGNPHDHPFGFTSFVISGGYVEKIWFKAYNGKWRTHTVERKPGSSHHIKATDVHQIISLPQGKCCTLILPGPWERKSGFWKFENGKAYFRYWDEQEFKQI